MFQIHLVGEKSCEGNVKDLRFRSLVHEMSGTIIRFAFFILTTFDCVTFSVYFSIDQRRLCTLILQIIK